MQAARYFLASVAFSAALCALLLFIRGGDDALAWKFTLTSFVLSGLLLALRRWR